MKSNIKEERMMVLNLIQEGKVTVEEATKLLEALNTVQPDDGYSNFYTYNYDIEDKLNRFSQSVDAFAKDVGDKMSTTFKDVEPKVKKATKTVVEKAVGVLDDISRSLNESLKNMEEDGVEEDQPQEENDNTPKEN